MGQCLERFGVEGNWRPNLIILLTQVNVLDGVLRGGVAVDGNFLARTCPRLSPPCASPWSTRMPCRRFDGPAGHLLDLQDGQLAVSGRGGLERVIVGCDYADGK